MTIQLPDDMSGDAGVFTASALHLLGSILDSPAEAAAELVENELDALATDIQVFLSSERISIVGNGHGMCPRILDEDRPGIPRYLQDVQDRKISLHDSIKDYVPWRSLSTLEFLILYAALSAKRPRPGERTRGKRGIGLQSGRMIGEEIIITSRPSMELAVAYWGEDILKQGIPTYILIPPTAEQLAHGDVQFRIHLSPTPLMDLDGNEMPHGTRVDITNVILGDDRLLPSTIRPQAMEEFLSRRFALDLREGTVDLEIRETHSDEGKRTEGGKKILVTPPTYRGIEVFNGEIALRGQWGGVVRALLYYDPTGKNLRPQGSYKGSAKGSITSVVPGLRDKSPWADGTLTGTVEPPDLPDEVLEWNPAKKVILEKSKAYGQMLHTFDQIAEQVNERIEELRQRANQRQERELAADMSAALQGALDDVTGFQDFTVGSGRNPTDPPTQPRPPRPEDTRTLARVYDEYGRGIEGVTIQLLQGGNLLDSGNTGESGGYSFGTLDRGKYILRIIVPEGMTLENRSRDYRFELTKLKPGFVGAYVLITGAAAPVEKPGTKKVPRILVDYRGLGIEDALFDVSRLHLGRLVINTDAPDFRHAMDISDADMMATLTAHYGAIAIVDQHMSDLRDPARREYLVARLFAACLIRAKSLRAARQVGMTQRART